MGRYELVDLTLRDIQELCDIRDDERLPFPLKTVRKTRADIIPKVASRRFLR